MNPQKDPAMRKIAVFRLLTLPLIGLLILQSGCSSASPATPENIAPTAGPTLPTTSGDSVIADGVVEPALWTTLSFATAGVVAEVLVAEGDAVEAGQLLVRLDDTDAQLAVQQAEAALAAAEARLAKLQAGARPEEIAVQEAQVEAAQAGLSQAVARRAQIHGGGSEADIRAAEAEIASAAAEEWAARDLYNREGWRMGDAATTRLRAAEAALAAAEARLEQVGASGDARSSEAQASVWAAAAQQRVAEAQLALLSAPPTTEDLAAAEAEVQSAAAELALAQAALSRYELRAPFAGTLTRVVIKPGNHVFPEAQFGVLATITELQVRTTDLTELSVGQLAVGHPVELRFDAWPDVIVSGRIVSIGLEAEMRQGDVTYPVVVAFEEPPPPGLRWGMTAVVGVRLP